VEVSGESFHAQPEDAGDFIETQSEEIFDLRAGDQNRDTICKSDDNGARNEFYPGTEPGRSHDDQQCNHCLWRRVRGFCGHSRIAMQWAVLIVRKPDFRWKSSSNRRLGPEKEQGPYRFRGSRLV
jgi:hypothetical protein